MLASANESRVHALLAQVQCTHARSIALCTGVHQRSPHSPPTVGQSWDLGVAHFSPFGTPKSGPEVQNGPFLMQKMIENGGGFTPCSKAWPPDGHVARCAQVGFPTPIP